MHLSLKKIGLACFCIALVACKKKATADEKLPFVNFSFDKAEYTEGETVQLTSSSTDATTFRWTMPDGTTATGETATYPIPKTSSDRNILFRLDAFSASGTKTNYAVKSVAVKALTNKLIIYQSAYYGGSNYEISIDGNSLGTINLPFTQTSPDCSQTDLLNVSLKTGTHIISYKPYNYFSFLTKTITINETACTVARLD